MIDVRCDVCGKLIHRKWVYKNKMLCYVCYKKCFKQMPFIRLSESEALKKKYSVKFFIKSGVPYGYCSFPSSLIGYEIKLIKPKIK